MKFCKVSIIREYRTSIVEILFAKQDYGAIMNNEFSY
jgi:hypothetical protein